jgi:hypothetical protein
VATISISPELLEKFHAKHNQQSHAGGSGGTSVSTRERSVLQNVSSGSPVYKGGKLSLDNRVKGTPAGDFSLPYKDLRRKGLVKTAKSGKPSLTAKGEAALKSKPYRDSPAQRMFNDLQKRHANPSKQSRELS